MLTKAARSGDGLAHCWGELVRREIAEARRGDIFGKTGAPNDRGARPRTGEDHLTGYGPCDFAPRLRGDKRRPFA